MAELLLNPSKLSSDGKNNVSMCHDESKKWTKYVNSFESKSNDKNETRIKIFIHPPDTEVRRYFYHKWRTKALTFK